jgi:hydrogenase expression/formation protein HypC
VCLAIPAEVVELLEGELAEVEVGGVRNRVSLALVDGVAVGDYVIVHTGFAITRLDVEEAEKTLALFDEIADHLGRPSVDTG